MRSILIFLFAFSAFAQAAEMECEYPTGKNQYATTKLGLYPMLLAQFGTKSCVGAVCFERGEEDIITPNSVCGYRIDQRWDCRTSEWNDPRGGDLIVQTDCPRQDVTAEVVIDRRSGQGELICYSFGRMEHRWRLGVCRPGR